MKTITKAELRRMGFDPREFLETPASSFSIARSLAPEFAGALSADVVETERLVAQMILEARMSE